MDGLHQGNVVRDCLPKDDIWTLSRVLDPGLMQTVTELKRGWLHTKGPGEPIKLPIAALADVARVGPAGHEAEDLLGPAAAPGEHGFPVLRGHDCANQRTLQIPQVDEFSLRPGKESREGRLTGTMSRLHINDNFRYNSQSTQALMTPEPSVGGRGWPNLRTGEERQEKALTLWLNTSLGLIAHWAMSNHTQNGLGYLSQKQIKNLPVLDVGRLSHRQLTLMAETFNEVRELPLLPANEAWRGRDPRRAGPAGPGGRVGTGRRSHGDGSGAVQPLVPGTHGAGTEGTGREPAAGHGATGRTGQTDRNKAPGGTRNPQDATRRPRG